MRLGCIRVVLQYLISEETRLYMCLGCIRVVVRYLTGKDHYRCDEGGASIFHKVRRSL